MAINIKNNGFTLFRQLFNEGKISFETQPDSDELAKMVIEDETMMFTDPDFELLDETFNFFNSTIKELSFDSDSSNSFKVVLEPVFEYLAPKFQDKYEFGSFLSMPTHLIRNVVGSSQGWGAGVGMDGIDLYSDLKDIVENNYYFKNGSTAENTYARRSDFIGFGTSVDIYGDPTNFKQDTEINEDLFKNIIIMKNGVSEKRDHPQKVHITLNGNDLNSTFLSDTNEDIGLKKKFFQNKFMYHFIHDFVKKYQSSFSQDADISEYKSITVLTGDYDSGSEEYDFDLLLQEFFADAVDGFVVPQDLAIDATDHLAVVQKDQYESETTIQLKPRDRDEMSDLIHNCYTNCVKTPAKLIESEVNTSYEILFHKIVKTESTTQEKQDFWVVSEEQEMSFIDTQVKLEEEYNYEIFSYVLVYGVQYTDFSSGDNSAVSYSTNPLVRIFEIPMGNKSIKITQPPQPTPNVEFKNITHSKNKIKIVMNLNAHEEDGPFYPIQSLEEKEVLDENYSLMNPSSESSYFRYETDIGRFQIFRTDVKPKIGANWGYENIKNTDNVLITSEINSTMVTYVDTITPFKKYYYVIRSQNYFGYYSQPTYLFEVELTQDADETFLTYKNVEFAEQVESKHMMEKTMSKLFQVVPVIEQLSVPQEIIDAGNFANLSANELPDLGDNDIEKVWGKDFKIRLTSKSTGKKIDFNINFKLTKN